MKDLIYRQDAIDALEEVDWYHQNKDKDMVLGANPPEHQAWYKEDDIFKTLEALPSAQPEKMQLSREDATFDCISRQAAIDALHMHLMYRMGTDSNKKRLDEWINNLPSAQPAQTDCEYCHEDSDGYVRPIEKNSHAWLVRRGRTMKLRVCFKGGYSECDILYCPMCGRRLTDE